MNFDSEQISVESDRKIPVVNSSSIDLTFIEGIRGGRSDSLDLIYKRFFPKIKSFIVKNSGSDEDARDIFQETLVAVFTNAQKPNFKLTCRLETYIHAIAKNLWLMQLRNKKITFMALDESNDSAIEDLEETLRSTERYQLYIRIFAELGEQCQKLLKLYMQGVDMRAIATELGFASESYAKKRKFKCKEQLINQITQDESYKRMME
jgi:RNA polymerase sigma factor (sigma-70 family)